MKPLYKIERWPLGWVLSGADRINPGIPMNALREVEPLVPNDAVLQLGILHHLRLTTSPEACICITTPKDGAKWIEQITESLKDKHPQERWWHGCDVGLSAGSIFSVFADTPRIYQSKGYSQGSTPRDAGDFGRCVRLLNAFPEWRSNLGLVALAYPNTHWPAIIARWAEIESAEPKEQNEILREIERSVIAEHVA